MKFIILFLVSIITLSYGCRMKTSGDTAKEVDRDFYLRHGQEVTQVTFQELSSALGTAMEDGGVENAVNYCKLNALPLVDSLSQVFEVDIRRTSDRYRNQSNAPNHREREVIRAYREAIQQQQIPNPKVSIEEGAVHYYAPIFMMDKCLKCHGVQDHDIDPLNYSLIKKLYPEDQAHGFKVGELRGIWSLTFKEG